MIPFNRPHLTGREIAYIADAAATGHLSGNGTYTELCCDWLKTRTGADALLTHSATGALEMAVMLAGIEAGDEVIMPSFTFVSAANAVVRAGGVPVFVDIQPDTLNIDPVQVAAAVTPETVAIMPTHYAGVAADMTALADVADEYDLWMLEDAAQGILATRNGAALGTYGDLGCLSFHETKNVHCGEGGALLVNDRDLLERARVVQEKGTDRARFFRGEVDKYTWQGVGSSFVMSEVSAAFLYAQLEHADEITARRQRLWRLYDDALEGVALQSPQAMGNAHIYWLLVPDRTAFIARLAARGVMAVSHYQPLHSSPAGRSYGRVYGDMAVTDRVADQLVRLPLWVDMSDDDVAQVVEAVTDALDVRAAA